MLAYKKQSPGYRGSLLRSTALLSVLAAPAMAQPAPSAHPTGGRVVGGQASITQNANTTTIDQTSERAALNWQAYNVGSGQAVVYKQPNAQAVALNTVLSANPSLIAGRITANGQVVLVNQSGVVFTKGAQIDTAGLTATATGIGVANFMAGRMVFDRPPHPGAIVSNAGNITVNQAGLAALVGPLVRNSGTITAQLGRVVLGAATTYTLDLYGDGMLTLNVTGLVTEVQLGNGRVPALVTNTGTILANGGSIVLSAAAVDGLIQTLVVSGGTLSAGTAGAQTGRILVQGVGGGIDIDGDVAATGTSPGSVGGRIAAAATGTVTLGSGARVDVSGMAGGGSVAVGAATPLIAATVMLAGGSVIRADALSRGNGGTVTVLAARALTHYGAISARGGAAGGDGGSIKLSTPGTLQLTGSVDAAAPAGSGGTGQVTGGDVKLSGETIANGQSVPLGTGTYLEIDAVASATEPGNITISGHNYMPSQPIYGGLILDAQNGILFSQSSTLSVATTATPQTNLPLWLIAGPGGINLAPGSLVQASAVSIASQGAVVEEPGTGSLAGGAFQMGSAGTLALFSSGVLPFTPLNPNSPGPATPPLLTLTGPNSFGTLTSAGSGPQSLTLASATINDTTTLLINAGISTVAMDGMRAGPIALTATSGDLDVNASLVGTATSASPGVSLMAVAGSVRIDTPSSPSGQNATAISGAVSAENETGVQILAGGSANEINIRNASVVAQDVMVAQGATINVSEVGTLAVVQSSFSHSSTLVLNADTYLLSANLVNVALPKSEVSAAEIAGTITSDGTVQLGLFSSTPADFTIGDLAPTISATDIALISATVLQIGGKTPASHGDNIVVNASVTSSADTLSLIAGSNGAEPTIIIAPNTTISAPNISLTADALTFQTLPEAPSSTGHISATGTLSFTLADTGFSPAGTLSVGGNGDVLSTATLANLSSKAFALGDTSVVQTLLIDGPLSGWANYSLQAVDVITEVGDTTGSISAPATRANPIGAATVFAATSDAASQGTILLDSPSNLIGTFSGQSAPAGTNAGPSTITVVTSPTLLIDGQVTTNQSGTLSLTSQTGDVTEVLQRSTLGTILAYGLSVYAAGGITLTSLANGVSSFDTLLATSGQQPAATGTISIFNTMPNASVSETGFIEAPHGDVDILAEGGTFSVAGTVIAAGVQNGSLPTLVIDVPQGFLSIGGVLTSGPSGPYFGRVYLSADGDIAETIGLNGTTGLINAGTLTAQSQLGSVNLLGPANDIGTLGVSGFQTFFFSNGQALALGTGAALNFALADNPDITLNDTLSVQGSVTVGTTAQGGTILLSVYNSRDGAGTLSVQSSLAAGTATATGLDEIILEATHCNFGAGGNAIATTDSKIGVVAFDLPSSSADNGIFSFGYSTLSVNGAIVSRQTLDPTDIAYNHVTAQQLDLGGSVQSDGQMTSNTVALYVDGAIASSSFARSNTPGTLGLFTTGTGPVVNGVAAGIFESDGSSTNLGIIVADSLVGSAYAVDLVGLSNRKYTNAITTLGSFSVMGPQSLQPPTPTAGFTPIGTSFALFNNAPLFVTGPVEQVDSFGLPSTISIAVAGSKAGLPNNLTLDGTIINMNQYTPPAYTSVSLQSEGSIFQNPGSVVSAYSGDVTLQANSSIMQAGGSISALSGNTTLVAETGNIIQSEGGTVSASDAVYATAAVSLIQTQSSITAGTLVSIFADQLASSNGTSFLPSSLGLSQSNASTISAGTDVSAGTMSIVTGGQVIQGGLNDLGSVIKSTGNLVIVLEGATNVPVGGPAGASNATQADFTQFQGNALTSVAGTLAIDSPFGSIGFAGTLQAGSLQTTSAGQVLLYAGQGSITETVMSGAAIQTGGIILAPALAADAPNGSVDLTTGLMTLTGPTAQGSLLTQGSPTGAENQIGRLLTSADAGTVSDQSAQVTLPIFVTTAGSPSQPGSISINDDARAFTGNDAAFSLNGTPTTLMDGGLAIGIQGATGSLAASGDITLKLYGSLVQDNNVLTSEQGSITINAEAGTSASGLPLISSFSILQNDSTMQASLGKLTLAADSLIVQAGASALIAGNATTPGTVSLSAGMQFQQSTGAVIGASQLVAIEIRDGSIDFGGMLLAGTVSGSYFSPAASGEILLSSAGSITEAIGTDLPTGVVLATALAADAGSSVLLNTPLIGLTSPTAYQGNATPNTSPAPTIAENQIGRLLTNADGGFSTITGSIGTQAGGDFLFMDDSRAFNIGASGSLSRDGGLLVGGASRSGTITVNGSLQLNLYGSLLQTGSLINIGGNADLVLTAANPQTPVFSYFSLAQDNATLAASGNLAVMADKQIQQSFGTLSAGGSISLVAGVSVTQQNAQISAGSGSVSIVAFADSGTIGLTQSASSISAASDTAPGAIQILSGGTIEQNDGSSISAPGGVTLLLNGGSATAGLFSQTATDLIQSSQGTLAIRSKAGTIAAAGTLLAGIDTGNVFTPSNGGTVLLLADAGDITQSAGGGMFTGRILAKGLAAKAGGSILLQTPDRNASGEVLTGADDQIGELLTSKSGAAIIGSDGAPDAMPIGTGAGKDLILVDDVTALPGGVFLLGTSSDIGGTVSTGGMISVAVLGGLTQSQASLTSADGDVVISATKALNQMQSAVTAQNGTIALGGQTVTQIDTAITAAGSIGDTSNNGSLTQTGANLVSTGGDILVNAAGLFTQNDGSIIAQSGSVVLSATSIGQSHSTLTAGGSIGISSGTGGMTQASSSIVAFGNGVTLLDQGALNQTGTSSIIAQGNLSILLASSSASLGVLSQTAMDLLQSAAGTLGIHSVSGDLDLAGLLMAGGIITSSGAGGSGFAPANAGTIALLADTGSITQAGQGAIISSALAAQAGGDLLLDTANDAARPNMFGQLLTAAQMPHVPASIMNGVVTATATIGTSAGGMIAVNDDAPSLTLAAGTITAGSGAIFEMPGSLAQETNILVTRSGDISLAAGGAITQTASVLQAAENVSETSAASTITIDSSTISAPGWLHLTARDGSVSLDGATFNASSSFQHLLTTTAAIPFINWPEFAAGQKGVEIASHSVSVGSGGATLSAYTSGTPAALEIKLDGGHQGKILFGSKGLTAPDGILLLNLDGGAASGTIATAGLDVLTEGPGITGNVGSANLQGSVHGFGSFEAASVSEVNATQAGVIAQPSVNLQINNCALTATDCVLLSPFVPPIYALLNDVPVAPPITNPDDDFDLPNVAREDF